MNLSHSKISCYETCSKQFKYRYIDSWKPVKESANFKFGICIHTALEKFFQNGEYPVNIFTDEWNNFKKVDLKYSKYKDWDKLLDCGQQLMETFLEDEAEKFIEPVKVEEFLQFKIDEATKFFGRSDYLGKVVTPDGEVVNALVDFKTSGRKYNDYKVHLTDQLTAYQYASKVYDFEIEKVGYMVLVKTKEPYIQWFFSERTSEQIEEYLNKVDKRYKQILNGDFDRQTGMHCGWCDYQALCLGDEKRVKEELIKEEEKAI